MLAYVFWHWKREGVSPDEYESRQRDFHAALAAAPPAGFNRSLSAAIEGVPWANQGAPAYEDWYLVADAGALDALNEGAISASRARPHDAAAILAKGGTAGLYRLRLGTASPLPIAYWFEKPDGMRYDQLLQLLAPVVEGSRAALWMRYMVLAPAPEFCLQTPGPVVLPPPFDARTVSRRSTWRDAATATDAASRTTT